MAVAPLERNVRRVLELAAVAGAEITLSDLGKGAAGLQPPLSDTDLFEALDAALSTRILIEEQDAYRLRHPLLRVALLEALGQHRRARLSTALVDSTDDSPSPNEVREPSLVRVSGF
jgi:hypothetical protein